MTLDRLTRIAADSEIGFRPSLGDIRWMVAEIQVLRARLGDATARKVLERAAAEYMASGPHDGTYTVGAPASDEGEQGHGLPRPVLTDHSLEVDPYAAPTGVPRAFLVDLDGTLADMNGRDPYDESSVLDDLPNLPVIETVLALFHSGAHPVFMSGRTDACRVATTEWLVKHLAGAVAHPELYMRATGDARPDWQIKLELFNTHIRDRYRVLLAIDDRQQVVDLWRSLGITCLQCAEGAF